jgi:hypothetical protein
VRDTGSADIEAFPNELRAAAADEQCGRYLYPVVQAVHEEYLKKYLNGK